MRYDLDDRYAFNNSPLQSRRRMCLHLDDLDASRATFSARNRGIPLARAEKFPSVAREYLVDCEASLFYAARSIGTCNA